MSEISSRPRIGPRLDIGRPKRPIIDVLQCHRNDPGSAVDIYAAEGL
jgi:hypothetical protein